MGRRACRRAGRHDREPTGRDAAGAAGVEYADVRGAFSGHEICDDNRWLHSVNFTDFSESYHPTADGHAQAYLPVFSEYAG